MPAGRPTKYDPEICQKVLDLFKQGKSIRQICLILDVSKSTFYLWKEEHKEFLDTINEGLDFSQGWWEEQGQKGLWVDGSEGAAKLNYTGWFMNMKNRFKHDWRDKQPEEEKEENKPTDVNIKIMYQGDDKPTVDDGENS